MKSFENNKAVKVPLLLSGTFWFALFVLVGSVPGIWWPTRGTISGNICIVLSTLMGLTCGYKAISATTWRMTFLLNGFSWRSFITERIIYWHDIEAINYKTWSAGKGGRGGRLVLTLKSGEVLKSPSLEAETIWELAKEARKRAAMSIRN